MKALLAATGLAVVMAAPTAALAANDSGLDLSDLEWAKSVKINGDIRVRFQNDDDASKDGKRKRSRIRARLGVVAQATDTIEIGIGLASGSQDPVSTNQTIGEFGSSKGINLDLAYFNWQANENLRIGGGKIKNQLTTVGKSQLQWDGDWRPEGFDAAYTNDIFFGNAMFTWLNGEEDKRDATDVEEDIELAIVQGGVNTKVGGVKLKAGLGYSTANTEGKPCFDVDDCGQNTVGTVADTYQSDYSVIELFAEAGLKVGELPLTIWGHLINNTDAEVVPAVGKKLDSGHQIGAQLGKAKKKGTWQAKVYYQDLDADATLAALANSDFAGGGTDNKGIYLGGAYALSDKSTVGLSYFAAEDKNERSGAPSQDYDTLQVDLKFKF